MREGLIPHAFPVVQTIERSQRMLGDRSSLSFFGAGFIHGTLQTQCQ